MSPQFDIETVAALLVCFCMLLINVTTREKTHLECYRLMNSYNHHHYSGFVVSHSFFIPELINVPSVRASVSPSLSRVYALPLPVLASLRLIVNPRQIVCFNTSLT